VRAWWSTFDERAVDRLFVLGLRTTSTANGATCGQPRAQRFFDERRQMGIADVLEEIVNRVERPPPCDVLDELAKIPVLDFDVD
jgi:hypothetical protein